MLKISIKHNTIHKYIDIYIGKGHKLYRKCNESKNATLTNLCVISLQCTYFINVRKVEHR